MRHVWKNVCYLYWPKIHRIFIHYVILALGQILFISTFKLHRSARFCCWKAMGRFRSNFWRRIRIRNRNQNQPITSGFWDIWGYVLEKWGFSLLLRLCTGRKKFFWFFSQMLSFSTTISLQNELLNSHERFFSQRSRSNIKFWHLSEQPFCWSVHKNLQSENWH